MTDDEGLTCLRRVFSSPSPEQGLPGLQGKLMLNQRKTKTGVLSKTMNIKF